MEAEGMLAVGRCTALAGGSRHCALLARRLPGGGALNRAVSPAGGGLAASPGRH